MATFTEYQAYDATGLARLIRVGEVSAREVFEAAAERLAAHNPVLNAVIHTTLDTARPPRALPCLDQPFAGVPFLFKDLLQAQAGVPMTGGSEALQGFIPPQDSEYVRRAKRAGLIPLGRTNVPEFGLMATTEPRAFGPTRNPWDPTRSAGGSSGGSAAAVAAGIVPMAGGSDGGGSIRIPAGWCGLFGLKPSRGRVPAGPYHADVWDGAVCEHVLTRSVRDSALMLDALQGPDPGAPYGPINGPTRFATASATDPPRLRVGFTTHSPVGTPVEAACREAVTTAAARLQALGHEVEENEPPVNGLALARAYLIMNYGQTAALVESLPQVTGRPPRTHALEDVTRVMRRLGNAVSAAEYCTSRNEWNTAARVMAEYHQRYDLYLTPTAARPPPALGELRPDQGMEGIGLRLLELPGAAGAALRLGLPDRIAARVFAATPFTQLANLTGQPAMSVPLHWTAEGLPVGVQFVAPNGGEALLLQLAGQLERAYPWFHRTPPG